MRHSARRIALALSLLALPFLSTGTALARPTAAVDTKVFAYDAKAPLDVQVVATETKDGLTVQSLTYASPKGGRVPATLVVPEGKGPFAGLLLMHGMPGDHKRMMPEAETLARRGAVAMLIDAPFARPGRPDAGPIHLDERDRADQIQLIVDLRRAVDLLAARKDVDRKRLGYVGISYGGAMGGLLAGVETRLAAYALVVGDGGLVSHSTGPEVTNGPLQQITAAEGRHWLDLMEPIEPIRFVGRAAPAHLLFQNGRQDTLVPPAHGKAYQQAGSEPKKVQWYDAGHGLNPQAVHDRHEWLAGQLKIARPAPREENVPGPKNPLVVPPTVPAAAPPAPPL